MHLFTISLITVICRPVLYLLTWRGELACHQKQFFSVVVSHFRIAIPLMFYERLILLSFRCQANNISFLLRLLTKEIHLHTLHICFTVCSKPENYFINIILNFYVASISRQAFMGLNSFYGFTGIFNFF